MHLQKYENKPKLQHFLGFMMSNSTIWWVLCGLLVATELTTGTLYLLLIALGAALAAVLGYFDASLTTQITAAALVSMISCGLLYHFRKTRLQSAAQVRASNNLDVGQIVQVEMWQSDDSTVVQYRGAQWQAKLATPHKNPHQTPPAGAYTITDVQGSFLILQACS